MRLRVAALGEPPASWTGTRYRLLPADRTAKLRELASSTEAFLLPAP